MSKSVTITRSGHIAIVKFDRKERLNAFDHALVAEMIEAGKLFQDDLETRAIIVTGADNAFSSGADLKAPDYTKDMSPVEARHIRSAGVRLCRIWEDLPQITIAAINGLAVGAGVAFAIALDWRVMDNDAYFFVPEVRHGWNIQWGTMPRLVSLVGPARAKQASLLCDRMTAAEALDWGLVDRVTEPQQAVAGAMKLAERIAEFDPVPVRMIKEAINAAAGANFRAASFADADQNILSGFYADMRAKKETEGS